MTFRPPSQRLPSIDIMRGIAILSMVLIHFTENLSPVPENDQFYSIYKMISEILAAPIFTFLVGVSLALSIQKQYDDEHTVHKVQRHNILRGALIAMIGFPFAVLVWGPSCLLEWDVLILIGCSMILLTLFHQTPLPILACVIILIMRLAPFARELGDYNSFWTEEFDEYLPPSSFTGNVFGFLYGGYFPILPWLAFPLLGWIVAKAWLIKKDARHVKTLFGVGTLFLATGITLSYDTGNRDPPRPLSLCGIESSLSGCKYPATTPFIFLSSGISICLLAFLQTYVDFSPKSGIAHSEPVKLLSTFSKFSFSIYLVHHVIVLWPLYLGSYLTTGDINDYLGDLIPYQASLAIGIISIALTYPLLKAWQEKQGKYGMEWLLAEIMLRVAA